MTDNQTNSLSMLLGIKKLTEHPASPAQILPASTASDHGIGLGHGPLIQAPDQEQALDTANRMVAVLELMLSQEYALNQILLKLGLDGLMVVLAEKFGAVKVRAAAGRIRRTRLHCGHFITRRALAYFCEEFGIKGDSAAARNLAPFFTSNRIDTYDEPRADSIRKALADARRRCSAEPVLDGIARNQAATWRKQHPEQDFAQALRGMRRHWKIRSPF